MLGKIWISKHSSPLLLGAGFGAFFAILKSKSESLWQERFEALKELCLASNTLIHSHESGHLEELGVRVMGDAERERLSSDVLDAKKKLRAAMANLNLLFKEKDLAGIEGAYVAMTSAMTDLHNAHPAESYSDYMRVVSMNAETLIRDAKQLARKKIHNASEYVLENLSVDMQAKESDEPIYHPICFLIAYLDAHVSFGILSESKAESIMDHLSENYKISTLNQYPPR